MISGNDASETDANAELYRNGMINILLSYDMQLYDIDLLNRLDIIEEIRYSTR